MKRTHLILYAFLITCIVPPSSFAKQANPKKTTLKSISKEGDALIRRVAAIVQHYHIENAEERDIIYSACEGITKKLDPYSVFLRPKKAASLKTETTGVFVGIGIEFTVDGDWLSVIAPIEGSPAFNAGIRAGDIIIDLNGVSTQFMSLSDATEIIRGKKGTPLTLSVYHIDDEDPTTYTIMRGDVLVHTIADALLIDSEYGTGYIRLVQFKRRSADELREAISELREQGMTNLILDLRANPGGVLKSAIKIVDIFVAKGIIVSTQKRAGNTSIMAHAENTLSQKTLKLIVLINKSSASASEIVAGAIKDLKRGEVLGEISFGKGSVQSIFTLPNLTNDPNGPPSLKLTTAHYLTPAGTNINHLGVSPTISVDMPQQAQVEIAQQRSLRYKENAQVGIMPFPPGISQLFPELTAHDNLSDPQLSAAIRYFRKRITK